MSLAQCDKETLRHRYEDWGVEAVRQDLRRPAREIFASPERNAFAWEWVEENEVKLNRREIRHQWLVKIAMVLAAVCFGVSVGLRIPI